MQLSLSSLRQSGNPFFNQWFAKAKQLLRATFMANSVKKERLAQLFVPGNYLVNRQTLQCYYVEEADYAGAMLMSVSGQILYIEWINDCGVVQPEIADNWKPAGYQQRQLHRLSVEINP